MLQSQRQPPKLLEQVRTAIRTRHYSLRTEETYLSWIKRFILFHGKRHPRDMGVQEVHQFLSHLAVEGQVAASTQSQALSAILFLYQQVLQQDIGWLHDVVRAKHPQRLPVVLTQDEVAKVLRQLSGVPWIMGTLLYGAGLRLAGVSASARQRPGFCLQSNRGAGWQGPERSRHHVAAARQNPFTAASPERQTPAHA